MTSDPWKLPLPHCEYVDEVCAAVGVGSAAARARHEHLRELPRRSVLRLLEEPSVVTIAGDRGSGKTTVLAAACDRLASAGHLVIPAIRPEFFSHERSMIATVIAHVQSTLRDQFMESIRAREGQPHDVLTLLERGSRRANLISIAGAGDSALRLDEQAADLSIMAAVDSDFLDNWMEIIETVRSLVRSASERTADPLLIVPIDDPDLVAPAFLRSLLLELRLMTSVEGIVGLVCLNLEEARAALREDYLTKFSRSADERLIATTVEAQLTKSLPGDRRVEVRGLSNEQKLNFRPLHGSTETLEELLAVHPIAPAGAPKSNLAAMLRLPTSGRPSPYASAISSNPRELTGLHQRLRLINGRIEQPPQERASLAAAEVAQHAVGFGSRRSSPRVGQRASASNLFELTDWTAPRVACRLNIEGLEFIGVGGNRGSIEGEDPEFGRVDISIGRAARTETRVRLGDDEAVRLDDSLTQALLMVRELSFDKQLLDAENEGAGPYRGGPRTTEFLRLNLDGNGTDNRFLHLPAWDGYYDYYVMDELLDELLRISVQIRQLDWRLEVEAYVIDFWRELVAVHRDRRGSGEVGKTSSVLRSDDSEAIEAAIRDHTDEVMDQIEEQYVAASMKSSARDGDLRNWVEALLPQVFHPVLVREPFIDRAMARRTRMVEASGRLQRADAALLVTLENRVKASLDERWVAPLVDLIDQMDPEAARLLAVSHQAAVDAVESARRRALGAAVTAGAVDLQTDEPADLGEYAAAMEALDDLAREAERRLENQ